MKVFTVDKEKCVKCGSCAVVCPVKIIAFRPETSPKPVPWADKLCIDCGHCVSVCPTAALDHRSMKASECEPIRDDLGIMPEQFTQFFLSRRSVRAFCEDTVGRDVIEKLIETARYAPTGHNMQPVKWKVFSGKDAVAGIRDKVVEWMRWCVDNAPEMASMMQMEGMLKGCAAGIDVILRDAPHVIIAYGEKENRLAASSCRIAMAHLELTAHAAGLGTCWAGYLETCLSQWEPLQNALELPEGHSSFCSMMLGSPVYKYRRIPLRNTPPIEWSGE